MFLFCPMALAIGRTGNSLVDETDGFTAILPADLPMDQSMGSGNLRLLRPPSPMSFPVGSQSFIELLRVENSNPEFQSLSRLDVILTLNLDGWASLPQFDRCVNSFGLRSGNVALGIAVWGQSRGVLVRAENTDENWQAINVIISSIKLKPGACDWK